MRLFGWGISILASGWLAIFPLIPLGITLLRPVPAPKVDPYADIPWSHIDTLPTISLAATAAPALAPPTPEPEPPQRVRKPAPEPIVEAPPDPAPQLETDDDGLVDADVANDAERPRKPGRHSRLVRRKRSTATPPPCPDGDARIASLEEDRFQVERDLVEYYANHLLELEQLASVSTHKGEDGDRDGFRIGISRCSLLHQAGFRSGDVVNSVNDRRIVTVLQAVGAYFALRREPELVVSVTRRGKPVTLTYSIHHVAEEHRSLLRLRRREH